MKHGIQGINIFKTRYYCILLLFFILFFCGGIGIAEPEEVLPPKETSGNVSEYSKLKASIEAALALESENAAQLKRQLNELKELDKIISSKMNAYKIQLSGYGNLLVSPKIQVEDIEKAWANTKAALQSTSDELKEFIRKRDEIKQLLLQTEEQYVLNEKQLSEINTNVSNVSETQILVDKLQLLIRRFSEKITYLEELDSIYTENIRQLEEMQNAFTDLSAKFDEQVKLRKKEELFKRKQDALIFTDWKHLGEELKLLNEQILLLSSGDFWTGIFQAFRKNSEFLLISCILLFGIIQAMLFRLRKYLLRLEKKYGLSQYPWRHLILQLFHRSLLLIGTILFFYIYTTIRDFYSTVPFFRIIFYLLLIHLFFQWIRDFLNLWNQQETKRIPEPLMFRLRILLTLIRIFSIFYVITAWMLGSSGVILSFGRLSFEIALVIWCFLFLKDFRRSVEESEPSRVISMTKYFIIGLAELIVISGLVLEFTGYGSLAIYWYESWGCTFVACLWGGLFFCLIREWNKAFKKEISEGFSSEEKSAKTATPIRWLMLQISWLIWLGAFSLSLLFAWGAKQTVIVGFFKILNKHVIVAGLSLSFLGFIYALLILLITHAFTLLLRGTVIKKILSDSGLGEGIKTSISTITVYLVWTFGILISLNIAGVSTTSLAVAFGALGIGLGFGLQNIFNNFISGIILLFERPIQIGDAIEINGVWGEVKKINVRSTLVQTYDNASLIIPNAEFISSQVTNWSFKDPRVRRNILVGVGYGSDVELVRQTLLEIADSTPNVFKYPHPSVLFSDFADSALIFRLRFWTDVDNCLTAESDIRFAINRLFKERNIEIPFPQRDIHIRSGKLSCDCVEKRPPCPAGHPPCPPSKGDFTSADGITEKIPP